MKSLISAATRRPAVMWALAVALLLAGGLAFRRLPLATRTSVELPRLMVSSYWPGASPEVIETYLTSPIEAAVQGVRGIKRISSTSRDDASILTVELEPRADVQLIRLAILERLELLRRELPPGAYQPQVSNYVPLGLEEAPLLSLTIGGPYTPGTLQRVLEDQVVPRLVSVPEVAGVFARGGTERGVSVSYDAARLRQLGIPPERLAQAVGASRVVQSLGTLTQGGQVRAVVMRDAPAAIASLDSLPVVGAGRRRFRLSELAVVRADEDARGQFFRIDGRPAVALDITRHPGADAIATAAALRAEIAALRGTLPTGVRLVIAADESKGLARELKDLAERGAMATVAVLLVLLLFMRRVRAVAVVMGTTVVAIGGTALTLYLFGIPANLLTLAGLGMGVGVLVQNAIVVVERLLREPESAASRAEVTYRMAPSVVGGTLTTAVVLAPFLYLQGDARAAFAPFTLAFVIALGWSVFTALVMLPAVARGLGTTAREAEQEGHAVHTWPRSARVYARVVMSALRFRWTTRLCAVSLIGVMTWGFVAKVPKSSFGTWGERRSTLSLGVTFPRGSDPATLDAAMRDFEQIVSHRPQVEQVRTSGGGASAQLVVRFTRDGGMSAVPLALQRLLTQRAVLAGGASIYVSGEGPAFSNGSGGGSVSSFRVQVKGFSYEGVDKLAGDLKARLERITRVLEVQVTSGGWFGGERGSQVTLEPDRVALARFGLTAESFVAAVSREVRGPVGQQRLEIGGEEVPVTVKAGGARDRSLAELERALLPSTSGTPVRISDVSRVAEREARGSVVREDQQYIRQVSYDFRGPNKLAQRTHKAFMQSLAAPAGYTFTDLSEGGFGMDDGSQQGLWLVFALGVVLVVLSVALVFDSVWGAAMVLLSIPLALCGVVAAFWFTGAAFTREAAVGVILVVGLAVNQTILLVDAALDRRKRTGPLSADEVVHAALDRAGMIVLVTCAAIASLVPLSVGTATNTLFGVIALATAGGTVAGTLGVLFLMPALLVGRQR